MFFLFLFSFILTFLIIFSFFIIFFCSSRRNIQHESIDFVDSCNFILLYNVIKNYNHLILVLQMDTRNVLNQSDNISVSIGAFYMIILKATIHLNIITIIITTIITSIITTITTNIIISITTLLRLIFISFIIINISTINIISFNSFIEYSTIYIM